MSLHVISFRYYLYFGDPQIEQVDSKKETNEVAKENKAKDER